MENISIDEHQAMVYISLNIIATLGLQLGVKIYGYSICEVVPVFSSRVKFLRFKYSLSRTSTSSYEGSGVEANRPPYLYVV